MSTVVVKTQGELDAALADLKVDWVEIRSPKGVWLTVTACGSSTVRAYDSSTVRAYGSSTVRAYDSSTVRAYGSSTVTAYGSSTVTAYGSSTVRAYDSSTVRAYGSSTVRAYGSATVRATGSATVTAYDSATVTATGSATVRATGSATVTAYDSATVTASDSATVTASDSATVRATPKTAVHLHSGYAKVTGGVLIDHTADLSDPTAWCEYHGVKVARGVATLYKAVDDKWTTPRGTDYSPGQKPSAPDWKPNHECGQGLHFSPSPVQALAYHEEATRFVEVGVRVADLRPIPGGTAKCKAPAVVRACREVTIDGEPV